MTVILSVAKEMLLVRRLFLAALGMTTGGCQILQDTSGDDIAHRQRPGYVIDSVRPIEVDLERFRANLGPAPSRLEGGAASMDELMSRFATAVEAKDTTSLQRMQLSAAEFAWLIYPSSAYAKPPYRQAPEIAWMQLRMGDVGLKRLVERRGGAPLRMVGHQCNAEPVLEGDNRLWRGCRVRTLGAAGDTVRERLFGVVIQRAGRFKFASYQNQY